MSEKKKYLALINNLSAHSDSINAKLRMTLNDAEIEFCDIGCIDDLDSFISARMNNENIIICGGDGSINYFINHVSIDKVSNNIYYYPCGLGNDFAHDVCSDGLICLNGYFNYLPKVLVNGLSLNFINGVGFGIDGYCCEKGDVLRKANKKVNYAAIAIKGLLFHYKPTKAVVTVDGVEYSFEKVWLSPTMKGKYYGGGMMISPNQDRNNPRRLLSVVVMHDSSKLKTLVVFPSIFKGKHVKHNEMITIIEGKHITVEFDRCTSLQVDGETILNVKKYEAMA